MRFLIRPVVVTLGALAMASAACKVNDGPNELKAVGMIGKWTVTQVPIDESAAGAGSCTVSPDFEMTIDSSAQGMSVSIPPRSMALVCSGGTGASYPLTFEDSLSILDAGAGPQHAAVFHFTGLPEKLLVFAWPDIDGDSIGGLLVDIDTASSTVLGQSSWSATRP
jgi:hypothetical protein